MVFASEALDCFMEHEYCLVIMDLQVNGMDGLEMLHIMRTAKHTPILVLTDPLPSDEKAELLRAGANAIIENLIKLIFLLLGEQIYSLCPRKFGCSSSPHQPTFF